MNEDASVVLDFALNKGFQIHPDAFKILERIDVKELEKIIKKIIRKKSKEKIFLIKQEDVEDFLGFKDVKELENNHRVIFDPSLKITSAEGLSGYNDLFSNRFLKLKKIILTRPEAKMLKTISTITTIKSNDEFYICGLVSERRTERNLTKLVIDDPTGSMEGLVFDKELQKTADSLLLDQFVMSKVVRGKHGGFLVKDIILPDVPEHVTNRSKTDVYAVFLSDLHIGSKFFMEDELNEFVLWVSSSDPIAKRIGFILVGGDVVDGIGIYPDQDKELVFNNVEKQLERFVEILDKVPKHIKIIIMPGNHDPGRRALPQPAIPKKYSEDLWNHENFIMVGNPAMVSLNGVNVLMFHGQSIDDIVRTTPGLSYDKPIQVMRCLLQARHLSPIFGSQTPIAPESEDMMVVEQVPDIFHTGHVHVVEMEFYKGVLMLNSGAWQRQTPFQTSVGITPTPGIAIIINLKNFKVYTKDFGVKN